MDIMNIVEISFETSSLEEEGIAAPKDEHRAPCYNFPDDNSDVLLYNM
jgi:hypothetical protein